MRFFRSRLLVIGASNVRRSLLTVIELARKRLPPPVDIIVVAGHGRSFGRPNRIFGWSLPGIFESDWSSHWSTADNATPYAIVTDVGNDILYGSDVEVILKWVSYCIDQVAHAHRAVMLGLPIERAKRVHRAQFELFREIFFKKSSVAFEDVFERAKRIDDALQRRAIEASIEWMKPVESWYGLDPIHIRRRVQFEAWSTVFDRLLQEPNSDASANQISCDNESVSGPQRALSIGFRNRFRLCFSRAKSQSWFGVDQSSAQPYVVFKDGTQVAFY